MKFLYTALPAVAAAGVLGIFSLAVANCGGGAAVCGNGIQESGEDCDLGANNGKAGYACSSTCKSISTKYPQINVTWSFSLLGLGAPVPGYKPPGCANFGATQAHLHIDGPSPLDKTLECSRYNYLYARTEGCNSDGGECPLLQPGVYQATVQLLRDDLTSVTMAVSTSKIQVNAGPVMDFPILFEMADFNDQSYKGNLDFHVSWGSKGNGCKDVQPNVTQESIVLIADKTTMPVAGMTALGTPLDGTPGACFTSDMITNTYERVANLPWGRYTLAVYSQNPPYCIKQPVFVNPGMDPDTYELIALPYQLPPDGGVGDGGGTDDAGMGPGCS